MGILLLAMLISGPLAVATMLAGYSFWMALAIYSGGGVLAALGIAVLIVIRSFMTGKQGQPGHPRHIDAIT